MTAYEMGIRDWSSDVCSSDLLALLAGVASLAVSVWGLGGPGAVIFVFAIGAVLAPADSWEAVAARTLGTAWGAALAWIVCALSDRLRPDPAPAAAPLPAPPIKYQLAAAGRITIGCGAAAFVAHAAGWQIGRESCREGGCQYVSISVVAVSLKKKKKKK